jgi:putative ABC transport system substrate-binding protein
MTARSRLLPLAIMMAIASSGALAQPAAKLPRVAFLGMHSQVQAGFIAAFLERMRALGYEDGRTVVIDYRSAEGQFDRLPALAAELVALKPDVIVTAAPPAVRAVHQATTTIPTIVTFHDPVGGGFAETSRAPAATSPASRSRTRSFRASAWSCCARWSPTSPRWR